MENPDQSFDLEVCEKALDKAVLSLFLDPPNKTRNSPHSPSTFIMTIYSGLTKIWDTSVRTACVNGVTMRINPTWFMERSEHMRVTLLAHECWHIAYMHMDRCGDRDHRTFNAAADFAINQTLSDFGFVFDKDEFGQIIGLLDEQYRGMSAEQIYDKLVEDKTKIELPFGADFEVSENTDQGSNTDVTNLVIQALAAHNLSHEAGKIPGEIQEMVDKLLNPKLPWYRLLHKYLNEVGEEGYKLNPPNRRYMPLGLHLPSSGGQQGLEYVIWGCDASGSMTPDDLTVINSEIKGAHEQFRPKETTLISFDTEVNDIWNFEEDQTFDRLTFSGRGGTDLHALFEHVSQRKHQPSLLIVMSDLECDIPPKPKFPVLWIRFGQYGGVPTYGKVINVDR